MIDPYLVENWDVYEQHLWFQKNQSATLQLKIDYITVTVKRTKPDILGGPFFVKKTLQKCLEKRILVSFLEGSLPPTWEGHNPVV